MDLIAYDDFAKLELKVGLVKKATEHPDADKLVVLTLHMGEGEEERQIVAGIRKHYICEDLEGMRILVLTNLEPRMLRGVVSNGMLLAATDKEGNLALLVPDRDIATGSKVG